VTLEGTLTATAGTDGVAFRFTVENAGDDPVEMQFSDAQRFDVTVAADGETVWRYGEGRMFAQMLKHEELPAGEAVTFEAEWSDPTTGGYEATATLTATDAECTATTTFSV
jgi:hypothetical protein